jgi:hypothetical protein
MVRQTIPLDNLRDRIKELFESGLDHEDIFTRIRPLLPPQFQSCSLKTFRRKIAG